MPRWVPPRVCIALGFSNAGELLAHARREREAGETFFEFRLDYLAKPEDGVRAIRELLAEYADCVVVATCRRAENGGGFRGSVADQVGVLLASAGAGARAVDLEIESAEKARARLEELRGRCRLIISYHNFESTPAPEAALKRMERVGADVYKLATTARKPSDMLRLLCTVRAHARRPLVVLAMGEVGFASRVLAPAFGALFTYAAPCGAEGTAPGQAGARDLRHIYRIDQLAKTTKIYGVIADPVRHSISPAVHNRAFQVRRLAGVYLPFRVAPGHLRDFMMVAGDLPVAGFSVTLPHKQRILRYLDAVEPLARRIGAVNTVWRKSGKWRGANADADGVIIPLARRIRLSKATVLVVGNGGAARSAAFALAGAGAKVAIAGRSPERVRALARACGAEALTREEAVKRRFDAMIHATPVGMFPHADECYFEDAIPGEVVFDLVYNPLDTVLIRRAKSLGREVIRGLEMFLEQAVRQFEVWTGETAPRAAMEKAAVEALAAR
jgi:3-dehydroquinate dehydratase/shikimate dehydrogenase